MATYVYAITRRSHPLPVADRTGVGAQAAPLRIVRADELAAVVSDAPHDLRAKRRDLEAHENVVEELIDDGPALPMRFGMVAGDDATVEQELAARAQTYADLLTELDGRVELNVKAAHHEAAVLRELLAADEELRRTNEALRAAGGGSHEERLNFGERVARALEQRQASDADQLLTILRPYTVRESVGSPVESGFLNVSFLVERDGRDEFEAAVSRLREEIGWLMDVNVYGPLPPYSFVDVTPDQQQRA